MIGRAKVVALAAALIVAALAVYAPVREYGFVNLDDSQYVAENAPVLKGLTMEGVRWAFTTPHAGNWHPLTWLSHMADVQLFGLDPGAFHGTNVALHIANTLLLFWLLLTLTRAAGRSAFVAALFAVHPLHVESVAWIAERKDVLSGFFFLLTLLTYVAYVRKRSLWRYLTVAALLACGLMAKPMLVTAPFVLLLLDFWPLERLTAGTVWRRCLEKVPFFGLAAASSAITFLVQQEAGAVRTLTTLPFATRAANALIAYVVYLAKTVWPAGLAVIYPYPSSRPAWAVLGALVALAGITVWVVRQARKRPYLLTGWLWFVGMLVPVIGLVQVGVQPWADRYTYLPAIGLFIAVAWGIASAAGMGARRTQILAGVGLAIVVLFGVVARTQVSYWQNGIVLWQRALDVTRDNYRAESNLGQALLTAGRETESITHFENALRLRPDFAEAHNYLGMALADLGRTRDAIAHYTAALGVMPGFVAARNNLGMALAADDRMDEAIEAFQQAIAADSAFAPAHNNLGIALARKGRLDEAVREFSIALTLQPGYAQAEVNLAVALTEHGRAREALTHFETAARLEPGNARIEQAWAGSLAADGRRDEALVHLDAALRLDPQFAAAHRDRGQLLAERGDLDRALESLVRAATLTPRDPDLHYDLGVVLARKGAKAEAIQELELALRLDPNHAEARRALAQIIK